MPPSYPATRRIIKEIIDTAYIQKKMLQRAFDRAACDRQDGFPDRNGDVLGVKSSDISDTTSRLALGKKDDIEIQQDKLVSHLNQARAHLELAYRKMIFLSGLEQEEAKRIADELLRKTRECENCKRIVANDGQDVLRTNRCEACYRHYRKYSVERPLPVERGSKRLFGSIDPKRATR